MRTRMNINSEFVLNRHNSFHWCQESHEIAKYSPACYDARGVCSQDEWSSFHDVNKQKGDGVLSLSEYLEVENNYIRTAIEILKKSDLQYLTIGYLEKSTFRTALFEDALSDRAELERMFSECFTGMRVSVRSNKMIWLLKLCLREKIWCIFVNFAHKFELSFGYDYYMILHAAIPNEELQKIVERNHLYLNARSSFQYRK